MLFYTGKMCYIVVTLKLGGCFKLYYIYVLGIEHFAIVYMRQP